MALHASAQVPLTRPSHVSLLTGLYPAEHGIRDNVSPPLRPGVPLLAEILQRRGFRTGAFVSSIVLSKQSGLGRGFDTYSDRFEIGDDDARFLNTIQKRGDTTVAEAAAWLRQPGSERRFAWVHLYDPHDPYEPPEPVRDAIRRPVVRRRGRLVRRSGGPSRRSARGDGAARRHPVRRDRRPRRRTRRAWRGSSRVLRLRNHPPCSAHRPWPPSDAGHQGDGRHPIDRRDAHRAGLAGARRCHAGRVRPIVGAGVDRQGLDRRADVRRIAHPADPLRVERSPGSARREVEVHFWRRAPSCTTSIRIPAN